MKSYACPSARIVQRVRSGAIGAAFMVALSGAAAWAQTAPIPVEAFGRLEAVYDVAISPDGRRVALAESNLQGLTWVSVVNLENTQERATYGPPAQTQLRGVQWIDDNYVAFLVDRTYTINQLPTPNGVMYRGTGRVDIFRWGVINLTTGQPRMLYVNPENQWADYGAQLVAPIQGDASSVRMIGGNTNFDRGNASIYRVALGNESANRIVPDGTNLDTIYYELDDQGQPVARLDSNRQTNRWGVFLYEGRQPRLLAEGVNETGIPPSVEGLLADGRVVMLARSDEQNGFDVLSAIDRATGQRTVLFQREGLDVNGAIRDPWTRRVVGAAWTEAETREEYFEPDLQTVYQAAVAALGPATRLQTWSRDRSRFVVYAEQGLDGGAYYLFTPAANTMRRLGRRYPELAGRINGERQSINYRASDGTQIPAVLTLPAGERTNLPLVLLPHGGPHGVRDSMDFDYWASFLVSRGYAVLQPNYRGSGGYGAAWQRAGYRQWGGLMQSDLDAGVDALVRAGIVDASRVCIVGASYGGYAALAGATMTPERYRCAVSVAGVSDLMQMLVETERRTGGDDSMTSDWWRRSIGDRQEDRESVRAASPANLAERVQARILLLHGTDDTVVPIDQSRRMLNALRSAGKDVRFVELRGDDHWLSDAPTRIQMLQEVETFLSQNLGAPAQ